jgi:hypothetical protein
MKKLATIAFALLAACATARVSTQEERTIALTTVTTFETALAAAVLAGKVDQAKAQLAYADVADLRKLIADSETQPIGWADLYQRALNLGLKWAIATKSN